MEMRHLKVRKKAKMMLKMEMKMQKMKLISTKYLLKQMTTRRWILLKI